ncbi:Mur ligase [Kockiozyma suomiensis]|uniref:Mur ligase n=1 Tax=Kockiozyma suomiensis TaxID=1337062 RepID=UPI003343E8DD
MSINLGLQRIEKLLQRLRNPEKTFKVFHVGGTNGKGSTCAYLSSILTQSSLVTGRFTSPHLLEARDSVTINDKAVSSRLFWDAYELVQRNNYDIQASNFELLTATAFEIFNRKKVDVAVIEVGLGGAQDSTNVEYKVGEKLATIITRIGMDHQLFLGDSIAKISMEKAGIIRKGVPCVVDGTNVPEVIKALQAAVDNKYTKSELSLVDRQQLQSRLGNTGFEQIFFDTASFGAINLSRSPLNGEYQHMNLACALRALDLTHKSLPTITRGSIEAGIDKVSWPGRLQIIDSKIFTGQDSELPVLLDGAHNPQAAEALNNFVVNLRAQSADGSITWVISLSGDRDPNDIFPILLRPGDRVYPAVFGPVEMMPWVRPKNMNELALSAAKIVQQENIWMRYGTKTEVITEACTHGAPVVIAGSLYLVSDVLQELQLRES